MVKNVIAYVKLPPMFQWGMKQKSGLFSLKSKVVLIKMNQSLRVAVKLSSSVCIILECCFVLKSDTCRRLAGRCRECWCYKFSKMPLGPNSL